MKYPLKPIFLAITSTIIANQAIATELEPVMVEADFRPTNIDQSTSSIAVINESEIQKKNAQHIEQVLSATANVNAASGASRSRYFQIRGIGERSQFSTPLNPSVGLFIDGMDYSKTGGAGTLFDVKQIEVLKGPQGTAFGSSSLAGTINIQSNEATDNTEAKIQTTIGSRNTADMGVVLNGPLNDELVGRLSVYKHTSDGAIKNTYKNKDNTQNQDEVTVKANLKWKATNKLSFDINLMALDINNGYDAFSFDNDFTTSTDEPGEDILKSAAFALQTNYKLNAKTNLEATITRSDSSSVYGYDDDWSHLGEFPLLESQAICNDNNYDNDSRCPYSAADRYERNRKNSSFDLRFLSSEYGRIFSNTTDWVAGIYYKNQNDSLDRNYPYIKVGSNYFNTIKSEYETTNSALYGQLDHHLSSKTTLLTGLRIENFTADYKSRTIDTLYGTPTVVFDKKSDETLFGGKIGITHQLTAKHSIFSSLSKGYKAGGINSDPTIANNKNTFDTETLWNLEAGLNSSLLNNSLKTRLTAFYAKRLDQQVLSSTQITGSQDYTIYLDNAATGENYGLETEADWQATQNLRVLASLGLLQANFLDYTYIDPNDTTTTISLNGRDQAHAPSYQFSFGLEYAINDKWLLSGNIEGKDKFYFSNTHDQLSKAYTLLNGSLEYANKNWTINIWGRNLTDQKYATRGYYFGIDPRTDYTDALYTQQGEPRTLGVTVTYDY